MLLLILFSDSRESFKSSVRTNLVSVGELGSLVEEELQGWQVASSAGPVDRSGLQLKHTHTHAKLLD